MIYQIIFYVPQENKEQVKNALFRVGAGNIGEYSHCAWETLGQGQFLPSEKSDPHIGQANKLETVAEYKVEMVCEKKNIRQAIEALLNSHPYEEPAYSVFPIMDLNDVIDKH